MRNWWHCLWWLSELQEADWLDRQKLNTDWKPLQRISSQKWPVITAISKQHQERVFLWPPAGLPPWGLDSKNPQPNHLKDAKGGRIEDVTTQKCGISAETARTLRSSGPLIQTPQFLFTFPVFLSVPPFIPSQFLSLYCWLWSPLKWDENPKFSPWADVCLWLPLCVSRLPP